MLAAPLLFGLAAAAPQQPNLVFFLADDFGHYDSSLFNPDAPTPHLKKLAGEGIVLNHHYVYQYCSPTRSSFISGRLPIHVNEENRPSSKAGGVDLRMATIADKLKGVGYGTTTSGKWHGGAYFSGQLPLARGFDHSLGFLNGNEDHYTQYFGLTEHGIPIINGTDLWEGNAPAYSKGNKGNYGDEMYVAHAIEVITAHDTSKPFFLYLAFQNTHTPLEVPQRYINTSLPTVLQEFFGMVAYLDEGAKNVTDALKARGMWDNTVLVFSADNGGECVGSKGNNYPLRGCKYTDFEGGVRATAFVSGGSPLIPAAKRGTSSDAWVHICDWYATFSALAGAHPHDKPKGAPASDGLDVWAAITTGAPSPRTEVPISTKGGGSLLARVNGTAYKYISTQPKNTKNVWTPADFPLTDPEVGAACKPCVFNIDADEQERKNLAKTLPDVAAELKARVAAHTASRFQTGDDGYAGVYTNCTDLDSYKAAHQGYLGPLCYPA